MAERRQVWRWDVFIGLITIAVTILFGVVAIYLKIPDTDAIANRVERVAGTTSYAILKAFEATANNEPLTLDLWLKEWREAKEQFESMPVRLGVKP